MLVSSDNVAYAFTVIGGGWSYIHDLYLVTKDDKVYHTSKFDEDKLLESDKFDVNYRGHLYNGVKNCEISVSYTTDYNGVDKKEITYLFDMLNSDGKVDFENFELSDTCCMDAPYYSLYKNDSGKLSVVFERDSSGYDVPAIRYTTVVAQKGYI